MSRKPNLIPSKVLNLALPLPLFEQMENFLFSDLEGRVPHGEYSRWLSQRIRDYFSEIPFDLALLIPSCPPGVFLLRGDAKAVEVLLTYLKEQK